MRPLDLIHVPLHGVQLIEASAGTGKTYTIASLYVRLLLEIPLQVREILVVTFTEAATDELKTRIRKKLHEALKCFSSGSCDDQFLKDLAGRCPDRAEAIRRLQAALRRFDEASIHTIHGFCQRVLGELPFEAGCLFEHELVPDQSGIVLEAAGDFIRLHFGESMLPELAFHAARRGYTLEFFLRLYQRFRPGIRVIPQAELPEPDGIIDAFRRSFARLAERWKEARDEVAGILQDFEGFKQNIYSPSILRRMIDAMDTYVSSPESAVELFSDYERFTPWKLRAGTKADFDPPEHDFFELWDTHLELHGRLQEYLESCLVRLKVEFLRHMEEALPARKEASGVVSFDDLLLKVRDGLRSERGADLGQSLRQRYRAALIDEFQDTDPVQYEIFSSVFSRGPLFLIGDPKQAIYSFRGADIFTYLRAAAGVSTEARHTLGKNFRSEPGWSGPKPSVRHPRALCIRRDRLLSGRACSGRRAALAPRARKGAFCRLVRLGRTFGRTREGRCRGPDLPGGGLRDLAAHRGGMPGRDPAGGSPRGSRGHGGDRENEQAWRAHARCPGLLRNPLRGFQPGRPLRYGRGPRDGVFAPRHSPAAFRAPCPHRPGRADPGARRARAGPPGQGRRPPRMVDRAVQTLPRSLADRRVHADVPEAPGRGACA